MGARAVMPLLAAGIAAAALLALAGCGAEDGGDGGSAGGGRDGGGRPEQAPQATPAPEPAGPAPTPRAPLPNQGTKRVAPGVPTAKGGDNSIQEFGVEGPSAERVEASRVLKAYLEARAGRRWARACAYLAASLEEELERFAGRSGQAGPGGCAEAMRGLAANVPRSAFRTAAEIRVLSMRIEGRSAFLVYRNGEGTPTAIPIAREGGGWRVAALDGSALVLGG